MQARKTPNSARVGFRSWVQWVVYSCAHILMTPSNLVRALLACTLAWMLMPLAAAAEEPITIKVPLVADPNVVLDGRLDEAVWQQVPDYDGMRVISPDNLAPGRYRTATRYFRTERGLYLGVDLAQPEESLVARLSSRDSFINRDEFGITLDTSGEGLYGYWFSTALGGSVKDGKVAPERAFTSQWDGPWRRATAVTATGWSVEMFLPWSMMAMPDLDGERTMGFWVTRKLAQLDERWSSPALPFTGSRFMSAMGQLQLGEVDPGQQFSLFPYTSYTYNGIDNEDEYRAGLDLFWRPSSNIQITATANPDFGAVESDDVVVNLTAFEVFFPDKRLFFLEGEEVFRTTPRARVSSGGSSSGARRTSTTFSPTPTTLVNTRRIGGVPDVTVPDDVSVPGAELGRPTELIGAVKVTGQTGGLRFGVLTAFEEDVRRRGDRAGEPIRLEQDGRDFGVARLLYEQSNAKVGRRSIGYLGSLVRQPDDDAVVHGVDTHLLSANGRWNLDTQFIASDADDAKGYGALFDILYTPNRRYRHKVSLDFLDDALDISDLGFIRRNDAIGGLYSLDYFNARGLKHLRSRKRSFLVSYEQNRDGQMVRGGFFWRNQWEFPNFLRIGTEIDYFPSRWDDRNSFGNGRYKVDDRWVGEVSIGTNSASVLSVSALVGVRQEELSGWTTRATFGATFKPNDRFSFDFDINYLRRDGWLVYQEDRNFTTFDATDWQPRLAVDFFISARQQLRLTMQWAGIRAREQELWQVPGSDGELVRRVRPVGEDSDDFTISRMTAQIRYRWEIGPLSDLFLVYTRGSNLDNRMRDEFGDLFRDALDEPVIDFFTLKLRYRFGR